MAYQRSDYNDKWRIERETAALRRRVGLDQIQVLDPQLIVDHIEAELFYFHELIDDDPDALRRAQACGIDGTAFIHPETRSAGIVLNCGKPTTRQRATLMEELAHLILRHAPSQVRLDPALGMTTRTFNRSQEEEAYDYGAALLLPKERIQRDVKDLRLHAREMAKAHGCSEQIVKYRVNRMRLGRQYNAYAQAA